MNLFKSKISIFNIIVYFNYFIDHVLFCLFLFTMSNDFFQFNLLLAHADGMEWGRVKEWCGVRAVLKCVKWQFLKVLSRLCYWKMQQLRRPFIIRPSCFDLRPNWAIHPGRATVWSAPRHGWTVAQLEAEKLRYVMMTIWFTNNYCNLNKVVSLTVLLLSSYDIWHSLTVTLSPASTEQHFCETQNGCFLIFLPADSPFINGNTCRSCFGFDHWADLDN